MVVRGASPNDQGEYSAQALNTLFRRARKTTSEEVLANAICEQVAGYTYSAGIQWELAEAMREFYQNLIDFVKERYREKKVTTHFSATSSQTWELLIAVGQGEAVAAVSSVLAQGMQEVRFTQMDGVIEDVCFQMYTNKQGSTRLLGGFGEGFKVAIFVLIKLFEANVMLINKKRVSVFTFDPCEVKSDERRLLQMFSEEIHLAHGVEFCIRLPSRVCFSVQNFQHMALDAQPLQDFVAFSPLIQVRRADIGKGRLYVGGLFVREEVEQTGLIINLDPSLVKMQRDRNEVQIVYNKHKTQLEYVMCNELHLTVAKLGASVWSTDEVKHFKSTIKNAAVFKQFCMAQYGKPTVVLVPASIKKEAHAFCKKFAPKLSICQVNGKVQAECNQVEEIIWHVFTAVAVETQPSECEATRVLAFCAAHQPHSDVGCRLGQVRYVTNVPPHLLKICVAVPYGLWDSTPSLWVPVELLTETKSVRVFIDHLCRRLGFQGLQYEHVTLACVSAAFEAATLGFSKQKQELDLLLSEQATSSDEEEDRAPPPSANQEPQAPLTSASKPLASPSKEARSSETKPSATDLHALARRRQGATSAPTPPLKDCDFPQEPLVKEPCAYCDLSRASLTLTAAGHQVVTVFSS